MSRVLYTFEVDNLMYTRPNIAVYIVDTISPFLSNAIEIIEIL